MHLVYLQKQFCITTVSNFSWVLQSSQEKLKTMVLQNFGGISKVHYGLCENGELNEWMVMCFVKLSADQLSVFNWLWAQLQNSPLSKKLCLVVLIASSGSFQFSEHNLNLVCSVIAGKSQTSTLMSWCVCQYTKASVWDFPVMTSLLVNNYV